MKSTQTPQKAPFPYFGGKSKVASEVWKRFSGVKNYIEPFFGSGAVLLGRPGFDRSSPPREVVNDKDGFVANFWRSIHAAPEIVAEHADWPINEVDIQARHRELVRQPDKDQFLQRLKEDPDFYDPRIAAWWVWGLCTWIGSGWCAGEWHGSQDPDNHGAGVVNDSSKIPRAKNNGIHCSIPSSTNMGCHSLKADRNPDENHPCSKWFDELAIRLRNVRVCCGDWSRVCTPAYTWRIGLTGIFLDPPYTAEASRCAKLYREDDLSIGHAVTAWAIEQGENPLMRIAVCGYEGEYRFPDSWECFEWKTSGGYANHAVGDTAGKANRFRERIWFSPHCLKTE